MNLAEALTSCFANDRFNAHQLIRKCCSHHTLSNFHSAFRFVNNFNVSIDQHAPYYTRTCGILASIGIFAVRYRFDGPEPCYNTKYIQYPCQCKGKRKRRRRDSSKMHSYVLRILINDQPSALHMQNRIEPTIHSHLTSIFIFLYCCQTVANTI